MNYIEILDTNGDILYRGENVLSGRDSYTFTNILTDAEMTISTDDFSRIRLIQYEFYQNRLPVLKKIKDDPHLTPNEKYALFKSENAVDEFYIKKIMSLLDLTGYNSIDDVPDNILRTKIKNLIDIQYSKTVQQLDILIGNEKDDSIIAEIQITKEDLINNVNEFLETDIHSITKDNFLVSWPTLLNPSPIKQLFD